MFETLQLHKIPTDDLLRELRRRRQGTYLEDAEFDPHRGRGHSSLAAKLLLELQVGDVKRIYHEDVFCHATQKHGFMCGLSRTRDRLKKQGILFRIYHEKEHVAIVARIQ
jgi:hypothetical protein